MTDNRNTILAVILSGLVLIGWQYFFNIPQMEKQRAAEKAQSQVATSTQQPGTAGGRATQTSTAPSPPGSPPASGPAASTAPVVSRNIAIAAAGPRIKIDTPRLTGSIALK